MQTYRCSDKYRHTERGVNIDAPGHINADTHRHTRDMDAIINTDTQISVHRRTQRHEKYRRTDAVINTDTEKQEQI